MQGELVTDATNWSIRRRLARLSIQLDHQSINRETNQPINRRSGKAGRDLKWQNGETGTVDKAVKMEVRQKRKGDKKRQNVKAGGEAIMLKW